MKETVSRWRTNFHVSMNRIGAGWGCIPESTESSTKYINFLFCVSSSVATLALSSVADPSGVCVSCVPIILEIESPLSGLDPRVLSVLPDAPKISASRILSLSGIQGSLAAAEIFLADPVTGMAHAVMSGLGFYVVSAEGLSLLPTYSAICGVNAVIGGIKLLVPQTILGVVFALKFPLIATYLKICRIGHPVLYAASCYYSWSLLVGIRDTFVPSVGNQREPVNQTEQAVTSDQVPSTPPTPFQPFRGEGRRVSVNDQDLE